MIKYRRRPRHGGVTVIAGIPAWDMVQVFALGDGAVVATRAGALHRGVIYRNHRTPGADQMTQLAVVGGEYVVRIFTLCGSAVMTRRTAGSNRVMIKVRRFPGGSGMTRIALTGGGNVVGCFTLGDESVVTL